MINRPPVPKFSDGCSTPKRSSDLLEEVSHLVFKMNLDDAIEKKAIAILSDLTLPNTSFHAQAIVHCAMRELNYPLPKADAKVEYLSKCIQNQYSSLISTLCQKLKLNSKSTKVCHVLHQQISPLINKLPQPLQNAISVKIATDIIYLKQGGVNAKIIAQIANIKADQLQLSLNRIKPFACKIIQDLFSYFNNNFK
ncbi:unnamed protein product (macronuclear) [Paramecium tetraurelia]|uniref:Uncharacterized protein n=1 Tax=Paramecium tetraurelia TaxID=5888 RepID=A0C813_PARTE|nr:uncharacterized protein GSPATT00036061001 [Paramecium tetraurelia]CAK66930.1 unnamed protein product [Paramecium tetraurelia]|eukprot:XP_001434327.1 hypothetical protein (macronuclear) [Paramecium tetraurelia strain d4-2]